MSDLLNKGQIRDLANVHQNGSDMLSKITQKQVPVGNGIGIPMILYVIRGKGVAQAARQASGSGVGRGGPRIGKASGGGGPRIGPPPFIGTWPSRSGAGKKNRPEK